MDHKNGAIIFDIPGLTLTQDDIDLLQHPSIGGVILFTRNYENPQQLRSLTRDIKKYRSNCLICVDQEGGRVQRFTQGLSELPSMSAIGKQVGHLDTDNSGIYEIAQEIGHLMALELRSLGVDLSFAPVLDLATDLNPVVRGRAIHHDPRIVGTLATHFMQGMKKAGMAACGKHFPGHGHANVDSHLSLPVDERAFAELASDLLPFEILIQNQLPAIMPGHLLFPKIDAMPAGFSKTWLQTILREQLGFKGTIVCDDLIMQATLEYGDTADCSEKALSAGCDYILICNDRAAVERVIDKVTIDFSNEVVERRENLLPKKQSIAWEELSQNPIWQTAKHSLDSFYALS